MKRAATLFFLVGGATSAASVATTQHTSEGQFAQAAGSVGFLVLGVLLLVLPARRRTIESALLASIGVLSAMLAGLDPVGVTTFFYLWPIVFAAYFCGTRMLLTAVAFMTVTATAGLMLNPHAVNPSDTLSNTLISVGLMGGLVAVMQRREARLRVDLEAAAQLDPLTGLLNRRAFNPALATMLADATRDASALSLVLFDLDHFKHYNDTHGHVEGDLALRRFAAVLQSEAGPADRVARFGGEEFVVVLPAGAEAGMAFAERIGARLAYERIDGSRQLSTSAGVSSVEDREDLTVDGLIRRADEALYSAKDAGRRRAVRWLANDATGTAREHAKQPTVVAATQPGPRPTVHATTA